MGSKKGRAIFLLISIAFLPFLVRTGLDPEKIREQAVERVYHQWKSSSAGRLLADGAELHLHDSVLRTPFHHHFRAHLAKDFILFTDARYPRVSVEFTDSDYLWGSIYVETSPGVRHLWQGHTRLVNNGFLVAVWIAGLILIGGLGLWLATTIYASVVFLWASHWNPLSFFEFIFERFLTGFSFLYGDFDRKELIFIISMGSLVLCFVGRFVFKKAKIKWDETTRRKLFWLSIVVEPAILSLGFSFFQWADTEAWWKIYFYSWVGRFFTVSLMGYLVFLEKKFRYVYQISQGEQNKPLKPFALAAFLPFVFYFGLGWEWVNALGSSAEAPVLLFLKTLAVSFVLSVVLGSRLLSIFVGVLVFPLLIPMGSTPLEIGFMLGVFFDGLLIGWLLSPWMMWCEPWRLMIDRRPFYTLILSTILIGVMLSSVGIPYVVSWVLLAMMAWGFYNLYLSYKAKEMHREFF